MLVNRLKLGPQGQGRRFNLEGRPVQRLVSSTKRNTLHSKMNLSVFKPQGQPRCTSRVNDAAPGSVAQQPEIQQDSSAYFNLSNVRNALIRQEDTTLFNLIERAQFARNAPVYAPFCLSLTGPGGEDCEFSLLEYLLRETEQLHGRIRRYTSSDEHPFFPDDVPPVIMPPIQYAEILPPSARKINFNDRILDLYLTVILDGITEEGDDGNYGSSSMYDVFCLQALSRRIHFGKFVAEAKFRSNPEAYTTLIKNKDSKGLMDLLTNEKVEDEVAERVRLKAVTYGQDPQEAAAGKGSYKVHPDVVSNLFREWIIPMTKEVQVECLLRRFDDVNDS